MKGGGRNLSQSAMRSAKYRNPEGAAKYFGPYRIRKRLNEIEVPDVVYDLTNLKNGINGKIWEKGGHLKPIVREKLLKIANLFYESLHVDFPILDIYFTGSLANYNWTNQSDIDVHLILDIPKGEDKDFLAEYIDAKKESWKNKYDIKIYGFPVELFAKDTEDFHKNKAVYSLKKDEWVVRPSKKNIKIDAESIKEKSADIMSDIDNAIEIGNSNDRLDAIDKIKDRIKRMRKAGLEKGGEYSVENLVFKTLRGNGYLEKLTSEKASIVDKDLSLKEGLVDKKINTLKVMKGIPGMTDEKINIIKDFINFTCCKLKMENPVIVVLRNGRDSYISTTAAYDPQNNINHIRCGGRALIDICGSIGHELTHNRQRELGKFNPGDYVQNIGGHIEDEANSIMGILKKDFTHNYGYDHIYDI